MVNRETIENIITKTIIIHKCPRTGTKPTSGIIYPQGEAPKYELNNGNLDRDLLNQIADDMAERWGLEVSLDSKGRREIAMNKFNLWDDEHKTLIRMGKMINHQDWIDFTNGNARFRASYTLDDVLRYYTEMEDVGKTRASAIIFETNDGASYNRLYNGSYKMANTVEISSMCYGNQGTNVPSEYHLKQVMAHEFGHASERLLTSEDVRILEKSCVGKNKFSKKNLTSSETEVFNTLLGFGSTRGKANAISYSEEYENAMRSNKVPFASKYAKSKHNYGLTGKCEDFAEVMSAVAYRKTNDKQNFRIKYANGDVVGYDEFVNDHKETFKICCDYVDGKISHTDLHDPIHHNKFN